MASKDTGTVNIHGKEYKTVAARVQEFRELHKFQFSIETDIVERTTDEVVMRATIRSIDGRVVATGYAEEKRTSSQINRTSALENAETSAIGRALAAFGLAGTEYASADEVAQAITQQRSPAPVAPAPKPQPASHVEQVRQVFPEAEAEFAQKAVTASDASDKPPTPAQLNRIREIRKELGYAESQTESKIKLLRTQAQAGAAVGKLKAELDAYKASEGGE